MRNNIITGIIVGIAVPSIIFVAGLLNDWWQKSPIADGIIVMSAQECSQLGDGWKVYPDVGGKFPIASGSWDDGTEKRAFSPGDTGGEYRHKLTVDEMPKHTHDYQTKKETKRQSGDSTEVWWSEQSRATSPAGGDVPHNNVPPYLVLNFCIKS